MGCGTVFMRSGLFWPILLLISRSILRREIYKRTFTREQREVHMYVHELMVWWVWQNFDCGGHTHTPPVIRQASTCFRLSARPNLLPWTGATTNCHVAEFPHHQSSKCMRTLNRKFNVFFLFFLTVGEILLRWGWPWSKYRLFDFFNIKFDHSFYLKNVCKYSQI